MNPRGENPGTAPPRRLTPAVAAAVCAAALLAGCRSSDGLLGRKSGPEGSLTSRDPLLGGTRIPPQNLPVPGKDGYGAREKKDPLLGAPAGRDGAGERAGQGDAKGSASRGPTKDEPFRPGPGTTNAALAGHLVPDDTLSIGDRRTPGKAAGRPAPRDGGPEFELVADELRRCGATVEPAARAGDGFEVRASVPLDGPGLIRQYTGAGPTPAAAARQVLDQVKSDRK
jgi:hypothetical protein